MAVIADYAWIYDYGHLPRLTFQGWNLLQNSTLVSRI